MVQSVKTHSSLLSVLNLDTQLDYHQLIDQLQQATQPLSLSCLRFLLDNVNISNEQVMQLASFDEKNYCRKRLFRNDHCEVLMLSWLNGQRSKIHDHLNAACGVKILNGEAIETQFEKSANGLIYATKSTQFAQGSVTVSRDDDIHQISNLQADNKPLITLHIYSPPLQKFNLYQLESGQAELLDLEQDSWFYQI